MNTLKITSPAFSMNGPIPSRYTCDGDDVNPPLAKNEQVGHYTRK